MIRKVRHWLRGHWYIMIKRPINGHTSLEELNSTLEQIEGNKVRICALVEKMAQENGDAKKVIEDHGHSTRRLES